MATATMTPNKARWLGRLLLACVAALLGVVALSLWRPLFVFNTVATAWLRAAGIRSQNVRLGQYRIHYFAGGQGEPLVLVHGLGARALTFTPLMLGLAQSHRIYALDLLGYGDSDRPNVDYSIPLETEVLRQFAESQGLQRMDLAGWSMGGWISLNYAAQHPDRVRRLVLLDSAGMAFVPSFDIYLLAPRTMHDMRGLENLLTPHPATYAFIEHDLLRYLRRESWVVDRALASMITGDDVMNGKLQNVTMPVLLVWGKQDILTPLSLAEEMHREMPQSVLVTLDGCGHIAPIECSSRVLPEMRRFLETDH